MKLAGRSWPLVGRTDELDAIEESLEHDRGVLVAGPAGVGKSRLLNAVTDRLSTDGAAVLKIAGVESVGASPWSSFVTKAETADLATAVVDYVTRRRRDGRVVVAVDDAQLLDDASAAALHRVTQSGVAEVLVGLRTGEPSSRAVTAVWKDGLVHRLDLRPLHEVEVAELVRNVVGPVTSRQVRWLWETSRGHPLFLRELIDGLTASGSLCVTDGTVELDEHASTPVRLLDLIHQHIKRHGDEATDLLAMLAICQPIDEATIDRLGLASRAGRLISDDLATRAGRALVVAHPLYGEAAIAATPMRRLDDLRLRASAALAEIPGRKRHAVLLSLDSGEQAEPALTVEAIAEALTNYQPEIALRLGRVLPPRHHTASVATDLAVAHAMIGDHLASDDEFDRALAMTEPDKRGALWLRRIGTIFDYRHDASAAFELSSQAMQDVSLGEAQALQALLLRPRMFVEPLDTISAELRALIDEPNLDPRAAETLYLDAATVGWFLLRSDESFGFVERALESAKPESADFFRARHTKVSLLTWRHGIGAALDQAAVDHAQAATSGTGEAQLLAAIAFVFPAARAGAANVALRIANVVLDQGRYATHRRHEGVVLGELALAASAVPSRHDDAEAALGMIDALPPAMQVNPQPPAWLARSRLTRSAGDVEAANQQLQTALDRARWRKKRTYELLCLRERAYNGGVDEADLAAFEVIEVQAGSGLAAIFADEARALHQRNACALDAAAIRLAHYGAVARAAEASAAAQRLHQSSGDHALALSAQLRTEHLIAGFGSSWQPPLLDLGDPVLSERERQVADVVASGSSNAEVADELFVSPHTVKGHLERIYTKLGIHSRQELTGIYSTAKAICEPFGKPLLDIEAACAPVLI